MSKKKLKVSIFELVWYILTGACAVWGVTYVVLGLVAKFYPATSENNPLGQADGKFADTFGLGFLYWGLIILAIAVVAAVIVLCLTAKTSDREVEKAQRRAARLALNEEAPKVEETKVVDAEVEETKAE